jgi:hypothetical protein
MREVNQVRKVREERKVERKKVNQARFGKVRKVKK